MIQPYTTQLANPTTSTTSPLTHRLANFSTRFRLQANSAPVYFLSTSLTRIKNLAHLHHKPNQSISPFTLGNQRGRDNYASMSQALGLKAHHCGCNGIALTPLCTNRYATSCSLGNAVRTSPPGPDQNNSADAAARGHTMESRFEGPDCSAHNSCCPIGM